MSADFDSAMDEMQVSIIEDTQKIYSEEVIEKWMSPPRMGEMKKPHGYGKVKGPCGDTIKIFLQIYDERITDARFVADGCATTIAAGSMACELVIGKNSKEMEGYRVQYNNSVFSGQKVELDGKYFNHCTFKDCIIVLEKGETTVAGCSFEAVNYSLKAMPMLLEK